MASPEQVAVNFNDSLPELCRFSVLHFAFHSKVDEYR